MIREVGVAAVQMCNVSDNKGDNIGRAIHLIEEGANRGSRIACLPELFSTAYFPATESNSLFSLAEPVPGPTTDRLSKTAVRLGLYVVGSIFEKDQKAKRYFNCGFVINPNGTIVGKYRKVHIPLVDHKDKFLNEKYYFEPGDLGFPVFELEGFKVGVLICYDRSFPEAWRCLVSRGAELVFVPTASSGWRQENWECGLKTRALENTVFVVAPNRAGKETFYRKNNPDFFGTTIIVGPMGNTIKRGSAACEEVVTAFLDVNQLREARNRYSFQRDLRIDTYDFYRQGADKCAT